MRASEPELIIGDLYFPECMRWRNGELWYSDMFAGTINVSYGQPDAKPRTVVDIGDLCGGIGWLPDGDILAVSMNKRQVLRIGKDLKPQVHADLSEYFEYPTNDMYVDRSGRAYVSGYGFDADHGAPPEPVQLAVVEPDGASQIAGSPLVFPNGIDQRAGRSELLIAETFADRIAMATLGKDGSIQLASTFGALAEGDGPDGISCDEEGGVWVACAFGERVVHLDKSGEVDFEVAVPGLGVYDCLLTGEDQTSLLVAVASHDEEYAAKHTTGSIMRVQITR